MKLTKKFILTIMVSVLLIITANIWAMLFFSHLYFQDYVESKNISRKHVTLDYLNSIIDQEILNLIDNLSDDVERKFFILLEENDWNIPLEEWENRNVVVNYLLHNWVTAKFIEEFLPTNQIQTLLSDLKKENSPERRFIMAFVISIIMVNIFAIMVIVIYMFYFSHKTFNPIRELTSSLEYFKVWDKYEHIEYNTNDEIWLLVNSLNDLSERLNRQEEIRHRFLADISHELKTPITAIRCYLEWITDWVIPFNNDNMEKVISEISRLVNLVNIIMDYEKFNSENLKLDLEKKNITEIIKDTASHYEYFFNNNQKINVIDDDYEAPVDEDRFIQIVHNILTNFKKYAWDWTQMDIFVSDGVIYFKDNWAWVSKDKIPFLTHKFYQVDSSKSWDADERWIWVWLSIVQKIVAAHNWFLEIDSREWEWFEIRIFTKTSHRLLDK